MAVILDQAGVNLLDEASGTILDEQDPPSAATLPASGLTLVTYTSTTATLNGQLTPFGLSATWVFDWGLTPDYGNTATGGTTSSTGPVAVTLTGLPTGALLHYQLRATSSLGTVTGGDQQFITPARTPSFVLPGTSPAGNPGGPAPRLPR